MESQGPTRGPFRATQLWNELTASFRAGMPLGTHWQRFRRHERCFPARQAVDWLHGELRSNSNFSADVSRPQALKLLRKFLQTHVIEDLQGRWGSERLEDNGQLFRFPAPCPLHPEPRAPPGSRKSRFQKLPRLKTRLFQLPPYLAEFLSRVSIA